MAKAIGTLGNIDTLTVGGRVYTDLSTIIILGASVLSNNNATFRAPNGSSGYAVTSGKTLTVSSLRVFDSSALSATATGHKHQILQSDNDVGFDASTSFTNGSYSFGASTSFVFTTAAGPGSGSNQETSGLSFAVAATKYLSYLGSGGAIALRAFGYEA